MQKSYISITTDTHITRFTHRLKQYLKNEVYFFESPGVSTVIMLQTKASVLLKKTESRRFKISAANEVNIQLDSDGGLIQGVSDNFDAALSTKYGIKQTHSLATRKDSQYQD